MQAQKEGRQEMQVQVRNQHKGLGLRRIVQDPGQNTNRILKVLEQGFKQVVTSTRLAQAEECPALD
eukprot:205424-Pelagomonas_calceolata.AAC.2